MMRIFYSVPPSPNVHGLTQSRIWEINLYRPLVDLGHDVIPYEPDLRDMWNNIRPYDPKMRAYQLRHRPDISERLVDTVRSEHKKRPIDLFFSYFYSAFVEPAAIRQIGDMGIVTVNWYCNASYQFDLVEEIAPAYHYCLVPEKFRLDDYRRVGANPIYCQEAANPNYYKPRDLPVLHDIIFIGQCYGVRPALVDSMIAAGLDICAYGPGWIRQPMQFLWRLPGGYRLTRKFHQLTNYGRHFGPELDDDEYVQMYSRARIALGFSQVGSGTGSSAGIRQVRLRDFEAPMCGAFYLAEQFEELADFYEPGKEIVFFDCAEDLVEKCRYYLAHEQERESIRLAGMRRARTEHTWHNRFDQVFKEIGLAD